MDMTIYTDGARAVLLKDVKQGDYVKRKPDAQTIYMRGEYDRNLKRFYLVDTDDTNKCIALRGDTVVYIGFTY